MEEFAVSKALRWRYVYLPWFVFIFPLGRRSAYNWLTGSTVDTLAEHTLGSESLSSLLAFDKKSERQTTARRPVGEGFGLRRLTVSTDEVDSRTNGWFSLSIRHLTFCSSWVRSKTETVIQMEWNSLNVFLFVFISTAANEQRSSILRLRRRFLKDQEKVGLTFAHKEIQQQRQKKVSKMQQINMQINTHP